MLQLRGRIKGMQHPQLILGTADGNVVAFHDCIFVCFGTHQADQLPRSRSIAEKHQDHVTFVALEFSRGSADDVMRFYCFRINPLGHKIAQTINLALGGAHGD